MTSLTGPGTMSLEDAPEGKKSKKAPKDKSQKAAPATLPMVRVNLLPGEIAERQALRRAMYKAGAIGAIVLGGVLALWALQFAQLQFAQQQLENEQEKGAKLTAEAATFQDVNETYDLLATRQAQLTLALGREVEFSNYLTELSRTVPADTSLTTLTLNNQAATNPAAAAPSLTPSLVPTGIGTVTFSGRSLGYGGLVTWLRYLASEREFTGDYLTTAAQDENSSAVTFATQAALTPCSISTRYAVRPDPRSVVLRGETILTENTPTAGCGAAR